MTRTPHTAVVPALYGAPRPPFKRAQTSSLTEMHAYSSKW